MDIADDRHVERVSVRFDARRRWRGIGGSGRLDDGAGFGEGRFSVSRDERRSLEDTAGTGGIPSWENLSSGSRLQSNERINRVSK